MVRGVLLDVDGTPLDSNDVHARAWVEALAEEGRAVPFETVRPLIGMGSDKVVPLLTGLAPDDPVAERLTARRGEIFRARHLPTLRPFPRARELLEALGRRGLRRVVATSASEDDLRLLLERAEVADVVDETVSSGDVDRSKPDPDIVACALAKTGLAPGERLLVGDTPYDVAAARRAGVAAVGVRSGGWNDADLRGAVAVYADVGELCARLDELPLAGDRRTLTAARPRRTRPRPACSARRRE